MPILSRTRLKVADRDDDPADDHKRCGWDCGGVVVVVVPQYWHHKEQQEIRRLVRNYLRAIQRRLLQYVIE